MKKTVVLEWYLTDLSEPTGSLYLSLMYTQRVKFS